MPTENEILLNEKATFDEKQKIWDYEYIANKNRVCTYNFRSAFITGLSEYGETSFLTL